MDTNYRDWDAEDLLTAIEVAGRHPDPDLLQACLDRPGDLTPGLLDLFRADLDETRRAQQETWADDDPRWYASIHAGNLLLAFREPAALPVFVAYFRDPAFEYYLEWFEGERLAHYGPAAVPAMLALLEDETAWVFGRLTAATVLGHIAYFHPGERDRILAALRAQFPPLRDDGTPDVPEDLDLDSLENDLSLLWTEIAYTLARHQDRESEPVITALFEHGFIDPTFFGDLDAYRRILAAPSEEDRYEPVDGDPIAFYAALQRRENFWNQPVKNDEPLSFEDALPGVSGTFVREQPKVGRNEPCPCGSGKKYKKCCGR
ncbi:SEC-C domain-containing protein [Rhodocaloribacter litoris]|uniref:SEC-C metal-binding domain-containing protein n=1 Tax=Rhodocaloribacter litoris TaxID=2558931 RepID=UPI001E46CEBB|nr:SEC-C metal-binding domain-containing protein [Rhodocaloribacter litoris]QXD14120.1 SEC-C domain-containing protein [Rhodocaloribacter litoris]